jgi:hypothetical protein
LSPLQACLASQFGGSACEDIADGVVELADASEACRKCNRGEVQVRGFDQRARSLRTVGACDRLRSGSQLTQHLAMQMPLAEVQPASQSRDAFTFNDPV